MTDLLGAVREALARAGVEGRSVSIIELDRSDADQALAVVLAFVDGAPTPSALVKATPHPAAGAALTAEHANLRALESRLPEPMRRTVPRPMFCGSVRDLTVLVESVLPGTRIKNFPAAWFRSAAFPRAFESVTDWLDAYSSRAVGGGEAGSPLSAADLVRRYRARLERSDAADRLLERAVADLERSPIESVSAHGDFCVENVLLDDHGAIGVIDWEHPIDGGWPLVDLLHFLSSLWVIPHSRSQVRRVENHRRLLYDRHERADLFRDRATRHLRSLGLDPRQVVALSALAWAEMAVRKMSVDSGGAEPPDVMPRVFILDGRCQNLELLAENQANYVLHPG